MFRELCRHVVHHGYGGASSGIYWSSVPVSTRSGLKPSLMLRRPEPEFDRGRTHGSVRRGRSQPERANHPGGEEEGTRRRLSRRRRQRRSSHARSGHQPVRGTGRRCARDAADFVLLDRSLCDRLVAPARAIVSAPVDRPQPLRPVFPRVAYADACEDDRQDDVGVYPFAGERRGGGGKHQHEEQRVAKLVDENTHPRQLRPRMNLIRPERVQPADSLGLRKTIRRRVEAQQRGRLERPKTASGSGDAVVDVQSVTGRVTPGSKA